MLSRFSSSTTNPGGRQEAPIKTVFSMTIQDSNLSPGEVLPQMAALPWHSEQLISRFIIQME
ncbi:hypothetical protein D3C75_706610 [compost metagenome]